MSLQRAQAQLWLSALLGEDETNWKKYVKKMADGNSTPGENESKELSKNEEETEVVASSDLHVICITRLHKS